MEVQRTSLVARQANRSEALLHNSNNNNRSRRLILDSMAHSTQSLLMGRPS